MLQYFFLNCFTEISTLLYPILKNRIQQTQLLRRRVAVMNTRAAAPTTSSNFPSSGNSGMTNTQASSGGNGSGGMSPTATPSPVSQMGGMGSPHQGIGMKPGAQTPPANVLQVVRQVSDEEFFSQSSDKY